MTNFWNPRRKISLLFVGILFLLNLFLWQEVFSLSGQHYLKVDFLNIGQGDSIFIETPNKHQILIDGGPDYAILGKLAKLMPLWDRSLDIVILTHPDSDHLVGLLSVLKKYKVDYIVWTGIKRDGANYEKWVKALLKEQKKGSNVVIASRGTEIKSGQVLINTLNPSENIEGKYFDDKINYTGIVSKLSYGRKSFLFTADIPSQVEHAMISEKLILKADILKIPHHGSKFSSSEEFLQAVKPDIAVISVGKDNSYGHPTSEVLQRLENFGIKVLRTDLNNDIELLSDGEIIKVNN